MAEQIRIKPKDRKIGVYYAKRDNEFETVYRVFVHNKSGLWAAMRDLKQSEQITVPTADIISTLMFTVNYNKRIIDDWNNPMWVLFRNKTYRINAKPDEFNYAYGDMKLYCTEIVDNTVYEGNIYYV